MSTLCHKYGILISIDFGTKVSGTCYSILSEISSDDIINKKYTDMIQVTSWSQERNNENKTPTVCIYDNKFDLIYWGEAAKKCIENRHLKVDDTVKESFKLNLSEFVPQKAAIYKTNSTEKFDPNNMKAAIDYFREILNHTLSDIKNNIRFLEKNFDKRKKVENENAQPTKISVKKENIRFVITVPTQWNQVQKSIMRTIAKEAGMITNYDHKNRLLIINESLAAAIHCEMKWTGYKDLESNDKYIICDAGSGTIDLATFECLKSSKNDSKESYERCQLTADSDATYNSSFIDQKMRELLTRFCYDNTPPKDKEEEMIRDRLISPAVYKFIEEDKIVFGQRSRNFKFPPCDHPKYLKGLKDLDDLIGTKFEKKIKLYESIIPTEVTGEGDPYDKQCLACKAEDFKYILEKDFGQPTIVELNDPIIPRLRYYYLPVGVRGEIIGNSCKFTIPYDIMQRYVFQDVARTTINLIDRQIKKANGKINRTYLVGGFGGSPYLRKMILRRFHKNRKITSFRRNKFRCGNLIIDDGDNPAVMRGAAVHAIEYSEKKSQKGIIKKKFNYFNINYNTLICLDIGYETTSCSYRDLETSSNETIDIIDWPGLKKHGSLIPTAKESTDGKTLWGAEVNQFHNFNQDTLIFPSKLMASVKPEFRAYFCDYLNLVLDHVYKIISRDITQSFDKNKCRYVLTMENCYPFFNTKSEMRKIAIKAGIVYPEDPVERLLLINRNNASAMYNENRYFSKTLDYIFHFLQINVYHDTCHLSLFEAINLDEKKLDTKIDDISIFRNVTCKKSITFDFDFIRRIISNLNKYLTANYLVKCDKDHTKTESTYYSDLRKGFLDCINFDLDLTDNDKIQSIRITETGCCIAPIKVPDLLEYVFLPAIRDLVYEIDRFANQADMVQYIKLSKIFLSGSLIQANKANTRFLNCIFVRNISEAMHIPLKYFELSRDSGKEALLGASLYGNNPANFTERFSRATYAVNVRAYSLKEPSQKAKREMQKDIQNEIEKGSQDEKRNAYHAESMYRLADLNKPVDLFYQPPRNPFLYNQDHDRKSNELSMFIHRGDKISEKDQSDGIVKTFYARESCIAYISIYCSDSNRIYQDRTVINDDFRKVYQFEVYVKYDEDDPTLNKNDPRVYFDVIYTSEDNEAKFEARIGSRLGKVPDFYCSEDFLVANIYGDEQRIELGDLAVDSSTVGDLNVGV